VETLKVATLATIGAQLVLRFVIMNHDSRFIIGIAMIFAKTLIEHTPKSHLKKSILQLKITL